MMICVWGGSFTHFLHVYVWLQAHVCAYVWVYVPVSHIRCSPLQLSTVLGEPGSLTEPGTQQLSKASLP